MGVELGPAYGKIEIDSSGAIRGTNEAKNALKELAASTQQIGQALEAMGATMIAASAVSAKSAISLESAFAGVIKTTNGLVGTTGSLTLAGRELKDEFRDMAHDVPVAVEELMAIGELGGQLGVGREALDEFTETIAALGVSTNLSTEDAATALARMSNIYDVETANMGDNVERLGSTIVALGNNFATTESEITNFGLRIAGAGRIAGLTQAEILAIGTAMSSVGVQAEAGGTAVQKVLLGINEAVTTGSDDLAVFAETAGMTVQEFSRLWQEDAAMAFTAFVEGLGEAGDDAIEVLQELGLEDQRLVRSFLSLANAGDLLSETMELGTAAWEENTALVQEAAQRYGTTASNLKELGNTAKDVAGGLGDYLLPGINAAADGAKGLLEGFQNLPPALQATIAQVGALGGGLTTAAGGAMLLLPKLASLGGAVSGLASSLGISTAALLGPAGLIAALGTLVLYAKNVEAAHREEAATVAASSGNYNDYTLMLKDAGLEARTLTEDVYKLAKAMEEGAESSDPEHYKRMGEAMANLEHAMKRAYEAGDLAGEGIAKFAQEELLALATTDEYAAKIITETGRMQELANIYGLTDDEAQEFLRTLKLQAQTHLLNLDAIRKETIVQDDYNDNLGLTKDALDELIVKLRKSTSETDDQAAATAQASDEMAALAQQTGLSVQQIQIMMNLMGMSKDQIIEYAGALAEAASQMADQAAAFETASDMINGFVDALTNGMGTLRETQEETDGYARSLEEVEVALAKNEQQLGTLQGAAQSYAGVEQALDNLTAQRKNTQLELNAVTLEYQNRLANLDKKSDEYKATKEELAQITRDYKAEMLGLDQQIQNYRVSLDNLKDGADAYAEAQRENERLTDEQTKLQDNLAESAAEYNQRMLELSLSIAEQTGLLGDWAEQEFGPDLAQFADEADEVLGLIEEGIIDLDGPLAELVEGMAQGVQDALGETAKQAEENRKTVENMMTGLEDAAEETSENLQKKLDLKELLPYEDAVAAGVAVGQGIQEGIPDDPFSALLMGFSGAAENIARESGLIKDAIDEIPTEVNIAALLSGVPAVLTLSQNVQDALSEIPREIHINISAAYHGTDGAEWTPSIALFHAIEETIDLVEKAFPLDLGIRGGGGGLEPISPDILRGWEGLGPALAGAAEDMGDLLSMAGELSSLGGFFQGLYEEQRVDPMAARLDELDRLIELYEGIEGRSMGEQMHYNKLLRERTELTQEYAAEQERLAQLQEQQQQLQFLEQQQKLLEMIQEHGLDAGEILGGLELGLDASVTDLMEAMKKAMQAMIAAAEEELEIGSPSKVMMEIMRQALVLPAQAVSREAMQAAAMAGTGSARALAGGMAGEVRTDNRSYRSTTVNVQMPALSNDPWAQAEMTAAKLRNEARYGGMN